MRRTITFDDDVLRLIQDAAHRERRSMREVVNGALRAAFREPRSTEFVASVHRAVLRPGVESGRLNALVDELADDAAAAAMRADVTLISRPMRRSPRMRWNSTPSS